MEKEEVQNFLQSNAKYLPSSEINTVTNLLKNIEDEDLIYQLYSIQFKNPITYTLLYWLCPGFALIERFFIGSIFIGILKLPIIYMILWGQFEKAYRNAINPLENQFSNAAKSYSSLNFYEILSVLVGLYILWIIIDGFTIKSRVKNYNLTKLDKIILE